MEVNLIADRRGAFAELQAFAQSDPAGQGLVVRMRDGSLTQQERAARIALLEKHSPKELANALLLADSNFAEWVDVTANLKREEFVLECYAGEVVKKPDHVGGLVNLQFVAGPVAAPAAAPWFEVGRQRPQPAATARVRTGFVFAELSTEALTDGKAFDGVAAGSFTDMYGQAVEILEADLAVYVANTKAALAATRSESGDLVGLPIDARNHDKGDGAGWIVEVELDGSRIRFVPRWTEIGRELIGKSIQRFFSATIDMANKVILGGTLTNWPATRDPQGKVMLRPIEL